MTIHDKLISIRYLTYYYCYWNEQAFIAFLLRLLSCSTFPWVHGTDFPKPFHSTRAAWCWHVVPGIPSVLSLVLLRLVPPLLPYSEGCCQDGWLSASYSRDLSPCMIPDARVFTNSYFIMLCFSTTLLLNPLYNPGQDRVFCLLFIKAINYVCIYFLNLLSWAVDQGLGTNMAEWDHLSIAPEEAPIAEAKHSVITSPVQSFVTGNFHSTQVSLPHLSCPLSSGVPQSFTFPTETL